MSTTNFKNLGYWRDGTTGQDNSAPQVSRWIKKGDTKFQHFVFIVIIIIAQRTPTA